MGKMENLSFRDQAVLIVFQAVLRDTPAHVIDLENHVFQYADDITQAWREWKEAHRLKDPPR